MSRFAVALLLSSLVLPIGTAEADLWMPSVFGNGMVLQRDQEIPVWGEADAGANVSVSFAGQNVTTTAGDDGKWQVSLAAVAANATPQTLAVSAGDQTQNFEDVLVGEVWVCSGQSNMQWSVAASLDAEIEIATADYPNIRLYNVPRIAAGRTAKKDIDASWVACSPQSIPQFTAVGYFFGRTMHKALDVPVGLIGTSWGGTRAEAWTPEANLRAVEELAPITSTWDARVDSYDDAAEKAKHEKALANWQAKFDAWKAKRAENAAAAGAAPRKPRAPQAPLASQHHYSALWNGMVDAIAPFAARGAVWYQGESNAGRAYQYRTLMKTMIESWREQWNNNDFAFYQVQLANFMAVQEQPGESAWAELREAQWMVADQLDNAGAAVITDIGAAKDIHPKDKQNVGKRLARLALVDLFNFSVARSGPVLQNADFANGRATLQFDTPGGGSMKGLTTYYREPLSGFAIAGEDRVWHWAECKLQGGNTVICTNPDVPNPVAVRYNWADNPQGTLYNNAYLPAAPFRTDDWDGVTKNSVTP